MGWGGKTIIMHVLLIENQNLGNADSLLVNLQDQGHHVDLAHTPEDAVQKTSGLWPSVIVFNSANIAIDVADFQTALNYTRLDIPYLVATNDSGDLNKNLQQAVKKQKARFFRQPDLIVDMQQRNVLHNGKKQSLTPKEFRLLKLFIDNKNQILSRKTIMQEVWETDYMGDTRTLDVHIRWIREKTEENPSRPQRLLTIRGVGYRLEVNTEAE